MNVEYFDTQGHRLDEATIDWTNVQAIRESSLSGVGYPRRCEVVFQNEVFPGQVSSRPLQRAMGHVLSTKR